MKNTNQVYLFKSFTLCFFLILECNRSRVTFQSKCSSPKPRQSEYVDSNLRRFLTFELMNVHTKTCWVTNELLDQLIHKGRVHSFCLIKTKST